MSRSRRFATSAARKRVKIHGEGDGRITQRERFAEVLWTIVDRFALKWMGQPAVSVWESVLDNTTVRDSHSERSSGN